MAPQTRNDPEYLKRRHAQELEQAQQATHEKAREAHARLAERFAAQIRETA